ncbi:hypothetical protein SHX58_004815 [Escherichia coli]|nr:hypothetical protein [Escherichia coli]
MTNSQSDFPLNDQNFQEDLLKIKKVFADLITQASDGKIPIRSSHVHGLHHFEELYIRARAGMCSVLGYPVMVVSTISVKEPGTGIFRALLAELKCIADEQNYILKIENVLPPLFRKYLIQEGFVFPGEPWMCGSGYWFKNPQVLHENIELLSV